MKKAQTSNDNATLKNTILLDNLTKKLDAHITWFYSIMGFLITFLVTFSVYTTVNITKILTILEQLN